MTSNATMAPVAADTPKPLQPPFFDQAELRAELTQIHKEHGVEAARPFLIERFKQLLAIARENAERQLFIDGNGRACAKALSRFQDELIHLIYDYTVTHVYYARNPSEAERMSVIATGGYGRDLLAPGSDIDLLFLLPYKQTAWGESVVEYILYVLWDIGFKVGHATRNIDQSVRLAKSDITIRTSLLDLRLIFGDQGLFDELVDRMKRDVIKNTSEEFITAKLAEQDERHVRVGQSRYKVEPNIKEGKGGLRDLHTLHWLSRYLLDQELSHDLVAQGYFTADEFHTYRKCEDFLWTVRCHLHFHAGRAEERLNFEVQPALAERLGYAQDRGLKAVERFMKHYFLMAKDVGDLTRVLCTALELYELKPKPKLARFFNPLKLKARNKHDDLNEAFAVQNGRITIAHDNVFVDDPVNLIRFFAEAEEHSLDMHPDALRRIRGSLRLINEELRTNPVANAEFLEMLTSEENPSQMLRAMNEAGVLGRFIPVFGQVVSMMQFNMYHHFTVDEHLIRSIDELSAIEHLYLEDDLPLSSEIFDTIQNRRALYVATFIHDVAKGREEDHSIGGAREAKEICPRLGLTSAETDLVSWLIREHLTMSNIAQSRDLNDPKTIQSFAEVVQSLERLKLLLLLTVADIRAVGPGTWNGWKGQLLRTLYYETEIVLSGGHTQQTRKARIDLAMEEFKAEMDGEDDVAVSAFMERHYPAYWMRTDVETQKQHYRLFHEMNTSGIPLKTIYKTDEFTEITELTVIAPNHPFLLANIAGVCANAGANIVGADISTTKDGLALDNFLLKREFDRSEDEMRRGQRIAESIEKLLRGETYLDRILSGTPKPASKQQPFSVVPQITINNKASDIYTVIEIEGLDRPGLLYDLTSTLSNLNLEINSAHITTFGEKAVDVFYITDLFNRKVVSSDRQMSIVKRITDILKDGSAPATDSLTGYPSSV